MITTVRAREAELECLTAQIERQRKILICAETERCGKRKTLCYGEEGTGGVQHEDDIEGREGLRRKDEKGGHSHSANGKIT